MKADGGGQIALMLLYDDAELSWNKSHCVNIIGTAGTIICTCLLKSVMQMRNVLRFYCDEIYICFSEKRKTICWQPCIYLANTESVPIPPSSYQYNSYGQQCAHRMSYINKIGDASGKKLNGNAQAQRSEESRFNATRLTQPATP